MPAEDERGREAAREREPGRAMELTDLLRALVERGVTANLAQARKSIKVEAAQPQRAETELKAALMSKPDVAAESLGHIDYKVYVDELTGLLEAQGNTEEAAETQDTLYKIMAARNVLPEVLSEIDQRRQTLRAGARPSRRAKGKGA